MKFITDYQLRATRTRDMKDHRSLLIGGGSEPRETLLLDRVQFLNNTVTSNTQFFASNGPLDIFTAFADVTIKDSLFKDNFFPFSRRTVVSELVVRCSAYIYMKIQLSYIPLLF
jgi:hypothetical protein